MQLLMSAMSAASLNIIKKTGQIKQLLPVLSSDNVPFLATALGDVVVVVGPAR